ncbi:discoidin domain-containing protein [Paenibacillus sp. YIM B09110]|uniref:discoidin domain-containing protein n=1 Tax=Paenibacillus sp. YIM B09110 TaxID=3126102 RepID=UPI00301BBDEA
MNIEKHRSRKLCVLLLVVAMLATNLLSVTQVSAAEEEVQPVTRILSDGTLDYPAMATSNPTSVSLAKLVDGNTSNTSFTGDLRDDKSFTLDFGFGYGVTATAFQMQARENFGNRIAGGRVLGSTDGSVWTEITTTKAVNSVTMQTLTVGVTYQTKPYRYLKITGDGNGGIFSVSELRIIGERIKLAELITSVTIASSNANPAIAVAGDTITLSFTSSETISGVAVAIDGVYYTATEVDGSAGKSWKAAYTVSKYAFPGNVKFAVNYTDSAGSVGATMSETTDGSGVAIKEAPDYIDVLSIAKFAIPVNNPATNPATVVDTYNASALTQATIMMDKNPATTSDIRLNAGYGGYLLIDFQEGGRAAIDRVYILAGGIASRLGGVTIAASNDLATWKTISSAAQGIAPWQTLAITDKATYRYLKIVSSGNWFGNVAEVKFYGRYVAPGIVDSYGLSAKIAEAQTMTQNDYSDETWEAMQIALANAITVMNNAANATQTDLDAATDALTEAIEALREPLPTILEIEDSELAHPGVGQSKEELERIRGHVLAKDEPWFSYYQAFSNHAYSSKSYVIQNDLNPGSDILTPKFGYGNYSSGFFDNQLTKDSNAAYYQAVMYYLTGDVEYREKAIRIVRLYSMFDPSKATVVVDAHIKLGPPMFYMTAAAELLRSTSTFDESLAWTQEDTDNYITNFLEPPLRLYMHEKNYWFNQHQTAVMGSMSAYIFMDDKAAYDELVEWSTVNSTTPVDAEYWNGALANAFFEITADHNGNELEEPVVVVKEMMRDQPHSAGNIFGMSTISRMLQAQGTKVNPVLGTASDEADAVTIFEFLDDRFLKGTNTFSQYNLGYDIVFNDNNGGSVSDAARGRYYNFGYLYYYYKYVRNYSDTDPDFKYLAEMYHRVPMSNDDTWLYIPDGAAGSALSTVASEPQSGQGPYQIETRYTALDSRTSTKTENDVTYLEVVATENGTKFAIVNQYNWKSGLLSFRIRTDEITMLELGRDSGSAPFRTIALPDTDNEWRYMAFNLADAGQALFPGDQILYFNVRDSEGTIVDIDHMKVGASDITPPTFENGAQQKTISAYVGGSLSATFRATDSNASETISYRLIDSPEGSTIDAGGTFAWTPAAAGSSDFYVAANDGTTITLLHVTINVMGGYMEAIEQIIEPYDADNIYVKSTREAYVSAYESAITAVDAAKNDALIALKKAVDGLRLVTPLAADGSLDYRGIVTANISDANVMNLLDGNSATSTPDLWSGNDKSFMIDFGPAFKVSASEIQIQAKNGWGARTEGMSVFASNDGKNWAKLTDMTTTATEMQLLPVYEQYRDSKFRFFRFKDINGGIMNRDQDVEDQPFSISEMRIFGERYENVDNISSVTIASDGVMSTRAVAGDKIMLTFAAEENISDVAVQIAGQSTQVVKSQGENKYTAAITVPTTVDSAGDAVFSITYLSADGTPGAEEMFTTDGTVVWISDTANQIDDVIAKTNVTVSSDVFNAGSAATLFDNNLSNTEFKLNGSANGAWLTFDFGKAGADYAVKLTRVEFLARTNFASRLSGTYLQGSNDNVNWSTISATGAQSTQNWQSVPIKDSKKGHKYRYIRIINGNAWYGNMAEVRFFGSYGNDLVNDPSVVYTVEASPSTANGGTVSMGLGNTVAEGVNRLDNVAEGALVTVKATPKRGFKFVKWTQKRLVEGEEVDYNVSEYPIFNPGYFTGGYLGGSRPLQVTEDWNLTAHFARTDEVIVELANLSLSEGTLAPSFDPMVTDYTATVANSVTSIGLTSETYDAETTLSVGGQVVENGSEVAIELNVGENPIAVQVMAEDGTTVTYTVTIVRDAPINATDIPGVPVLSDNNGYDTGLRDGNYTITMNQWWGNNGTVYKLYENGELIDTKSLSDNSPGAQTASTIITGKGNGTYVYTCELINTFGTTNCSPYTVIVADAYPGKAVLSHDNWDGDGSFKVTMNLWWGTNASEYELYENGVLVETVPLTEATPSAQSAVITMTNKQPGTYEYYGKLINQAGETVTEKITVTVTR